MTTIKKLDPLGIYVAPSSGNPTDISIDIFSLLEMGVLVTKGMERSRDDLVQFVDRIWNEVVVPEDFPALVLKIENKAGEIITAGPDTPLAKIWEETC